MSNTRLAYTTASSDANRLRIARVAAAGRIRAERAAKRAKAEASPDYCERCGGPCEW